MKELFDLYSNAVEYDNRWPDMHGRPRYYGSGNGRILEPVLSRNIYSAGFRPHYPGGKKFAVCVSHDIDHLFLAQSSSTRLAGAAKAIARGRLVKGAGLLTGRSGKKIHEEYDLRRLVDINMRHDIRSSYYFLALQRNDQDFNYALEDIGDQLRAVSDAGNEIGLHGGHTAFNDAASLRAEKERLESCLGRKLEGYRNHYLKFELPTTWNNLQQQGFVYDTTLGYADCIGFRNGMCYPFHPYDLRTGRFLEIVELPLVVMDATLFFYMKLDYTVAFRMIVDLVEKAAECQGVFTLLWHNNFLTAGVGEFYVRVLEFLRSKDPWFTTSLDLVRWWKEQGLLGRSQEMIKEMIQPVLMK